jgi:iron-sulfur cluster assembly protein
LPGGLNWPDDPWQYRLVVTIFVPRKEILSLLWDDAGAKWSGSMASARPKPQVMRLTDAAADRIKAVMAKAARPIAGVRVGVKNGGCAGMAYTMEYADAVAPADEVVEDKGVRVLIDPKAVLFLLGTEMDYKVEKLSAQFVFNNPNQTSACGCGESVQITPATEIAVTI